MKSKFKKLLAAALVLCLVLALLPAGVLANSETDAEGAAAAGAPVNGDVEPQGDDNVDPNDGNDGTTTYTVTADPDMVYGTVQFGRAGSNERLNELTGVAADTEVIVYPTAARGYEITSVSYKYGDAAQEETLANDESGNYVFDMPKGDVTVYADFSERTGHSITIQKSENGTVTVESPAGDTFYADENVTLAVTPDNGYMVCAYSVVCEQANERVYAEISGNIITFKMPNDDVTVDVTFTLIPPLNPEYHSV